MSRAALDSQCRLQEHADLNALSAAGVRLLVSMLLLPCYSAADLTPRLPPQCGPQQRHDCRQTPSCSARSRSARNICRSEVRSVFQRGDQRVRPCAVDAVATATSGGGDGGSISTNPTFTSDDDREPDGVSAADADALLAKARTQLRQTALRHVLKHGAGCLYRTMRHRYNQLVCATDAHSPRWGCLVRYGHPCASDESATTVSRGQIGSVGS